MKIIGLTGSICSGKSTVSKMFEGLGARIIDADKIARDVVQPGKDAWKDIVEQFGTDILLEDKTIDRDKLGDIIFNDPSSRKRLNEITHPRIASEIVKHISEHQNSGDDPIIVDAPLLFESNARKLLSPIIVVDVNKDIQIERILERDDCSKETALDKIDSQMPLSEKIKLADYVINNSGSLDETKKQVLQIWNNIIK